MILRSYTDTLPAAGLKVPNTDLYGRLACLECAASPKLGTPIDLYWEVEPSLQGCHKSEGAT